MKNSSTGCVCAANALRPASRSCGNTHDDKRDAAVAAEVSTANGATASDISHVQIGTDSFHTVRRRSPGRSVSSIIRPFDTT